MNRLTMHKVNVNTLLASKCL